MNNFQHSYLRKNAFVNYLSKTKQWYQRRLQVPFGPFFSCHLSQDRISPLEAAVYLKFQSQGFFMVTPLCLCPSVAPLPRWMNELSRERCQVTPTWAKSPQIFPVWQSRAERYQAPTAGEQSTATCSTAVRWWSSDKVLPATRNTNSIPITSLDACTPVFRQKLKCSEWTCTTLGTR